MDLYKGVDCACSEIMFRYLKLPLLMVEEWREELSQSDD